MMPQSMEKALRIFLGLVAAGLLLMQSAICQAYSEYFNEQDFINDTGASAYDFTASGATVPVLFPGGITGTFDSPVTISSGLVIPADASGFGLGLGLSLSPGAVAFGFVVSSINTGETGAIDLYSATDYLGTESLAGKGFYGYLIEEGDTSLLDFFSLFGTTSSSFRISRMYAVGELDPVSEVPLPAAVWLLGSGVMGLAAFRRMRKAG